MRAKILRAAACAALAISVAAATVEAHGLAGKRFFPSTLVVEDPFVADELTLPSVLYFKQPASGDEPAAWETSVSGEWSKRVTPWLGLTLEGEWLHVDPDGDHRSESGFGNLGVGLKWQFLSLPAQELILSAGFGAEVGGTGRAKVGAESFSVLNPALFFGKGLGDLPDSLALLRPLAITASVGAQVPTVGSTKTVTVTPAAEEGEEPETEVEVERHPNVFTWGIAIQYSIPYLQSFVKDVGLPAPFSRLFPVVEVEFQHPLDRGQAGQFTGTVNPGFIWAGRFFQLGIEAAIPVNDRTSKHWGVRGMLHFFLDDLFPTSLGRPLLGGR
jgi:hypothetical protein